MGNQVKVDAIEKKLETFKTDKLSTDIRNIKKLEDIKKMEENELIDNDTLKDLLKKHENALFIEHIATANITDKNKDKILSLTNKYKIEVDDIVEKTKANFITNIKKLHNEETKSLTKELNSLLGG